MSPRKPLWPDRDQELKALCADPVLTYRDIGQRMGLTTDQVTSRSRKMGFREPLIGAVRLSQMAARTDQSLLWSSDRSAEAMRLWRAGSSSTQIAKILGGGLSRSAVIGKMNRMGVKRSAEAARASVSLGYINAKPKAKAAPPKPPAPAPLLALQPEPVSFPPDPQHDGEVVQLVALKFHHCRWPIGNPGEERFGFCGQAKRPDGPYCDQHHKRAFAGKPVKPGRRPAEPGTARHATGRW